MKPLARIVLEHIALIAVTYLMLQGRKMGFYLLCALATADIWLG